MMASISVNQVKAGEIQRLNKFLNEEANMPFGNNVLSLEEKLAVRDSFFKNPEFANITVNSKRAISGVILDFASTSVVQRALFKRKYGFEAPTHMVISPTERCNYQCRGCYAMDYEKKEELSKDEFQYIIDEGKRIGMRFFVITGGEDYAWKRFLKEHGYPLLDIFRRNQDCLFLTYTNGSYLAEDKDLCRELGKLGNVMPAVSIEGNREMTDWRRMEGAYDRVLKAWANLTEAGVLHGFSIMTTSKNAEYATSEAFAEEMKRHHNAFGFYFTYIPVGSNPDTNLMVSPEARLRQKLFVPILWQKYKIAAFDFWNNGWLVADKEGHACLAGGRHYLHVLPDGGVEPCVFVHFRNGDEQYNLKRNPNLRLGDVLSTGFFRYLRENCSTDPDRPCCIIDLPDIQRYAVNNYNAISCDGSTGILTGETAAFLDNWSRAYAAVLDKHRAHRLAVS